MSYAATNGIVALIALGAGVGGAIRTEKCWEVPLPEPIEAGPELTAGFR